MVNSDSNKISIIVNLLKEKRGFDFSGYRTSMLARRIQKRFFPTHCSNYSEYIDFLKQNDDELDSIIDVFTINVSHFFRDSLAFEYIRSIIIPDIIASKIKEKDNSLRIWSAGCAFGEEAYTMAIIVNEALAKEEFSIKANIFATDIDRKALKKCNEGVYDYKSIRDVKYRLFEKYFRKLNSKFEVLPEIKKKVQFSFYDMLDKKHFSPPDSIYGSFDIILCRNVLIYFEFESQNIIFNKLFKSLKPNGYLILGEAEMLVEAYKHKFRRENGCCKIFRKSG